MTLRSTFIASCALLLSACADPSATTYRAAMQHYTARDFSAALDTLTPLAQNGYPPAQFHLGLMHGGGLGVSADAKRGGYFLQQAASQGHVGARFLLVKLYLQGVGLPRDPVTATDWLTSLAKDGYAPAQYQLATHYERALGRAQDVKQAVHWYTQAAAQGHIQAVTRLARAYGKGELGLSPDAAQQAAWQQRLQPKVW
jgi:TPR repeat protein